MAALEITWFEVREGEPGKRQRLAKRKRTIGLADDGEVYCAPDAFANPSVAFLCACCDGVGLVVLGKHPFYPLSWLRAEWPRFEDVARSIDNFVARCREEMG